MATLLSKMIKNFGSSVASLRPAAGLLSTAVCNLVLGCAIFTAGCSEPPAARPTPPDNVVAPPPPDAKPTSFGATGKTSAQSSSSPKK